MKGILAMSIEIPKSALKPKLLSYLRLVEQKKEQIIVTDRGRPVAKILPFNKKAPRVLDQLRGSVLKYEDPFTPVGMEDWDALK